MSMPANLPLLYQPVLYHYTDEEGYKGIWTEGRIRPSILKCGTSSGGMAWYGDGVYLTTKSPNLSDWKILENNYDGNGVFSDKKKGRISFAFGFRLDRLHTFGYSVNIIPPQFTQGRDVWKVFGAINLVGVLDNVYKRNTLHFNCQYFTSLLSNCNNVNHQTHTHTNYNNNSSNSNGNNPIFRAPFALVPTPIYVFQNPNPFNFPLTRHDSHFSAKRTYF